MKNFPVKYNGKELWISRSVAVAASIYTLNEKNQMCILANKRGPGLPTNVGKWSVISGFIDYDETLKECCIREVHEETGVNIKDIELTRRDIEDDPHREGQVILIRHSGFLWDGIKQELTDKYSEPDEVADIKWIPISELEKYNWTSIKHIQKIREYAYAEAVLNGIELDDDFNVIY